jgi:hypothetical protein
VKASRGRCQWRKTLQACNKSDETKQRLDRLTQAVIGMFNTMQAAFNKLDYRESGLRLQRFLSQFDAIFTLNQDTLLETLYAGPVSPINA